MIRILNEHCNNNNNNNNNGLLLFNPPTGTGKTHTVLQWIYENYQDYCKKGRKIFFITNLKKNLPYSDLEKRFKEDKRLEDYKKDVLFINSNSDFLLANFEKVKKDVNDFLKDDNYYLLEKKISLINRYQNQQELTTSLKDEVRRTLEPKFRKKITTYLKREYFNKQNRLSAIKDDKKLQWIGKLYPSVFTSKVKIYFLSIDKFYLKNSTLVEPPYDFINNDITKDAIIFIDEFDATKDRILNQIIEQGQKQKLDYIALFNKIDNFLSNRKLPKELITNSNERQKIIDRGGIYVQSVENVEGVLKEIAKPIIEEYNVQFSFKTKNRVENERNLLFQDFQYHTIYNEEKKYIELTSSKKDRLNYIKFIKDKPESNELSIVKLLNQVKGFIRYFQKITRELAINYTELVNERRKKEQLTEPVSKKKRTTNATKYTYDLALSSVLEAFGLEGKYKFFITDTILTQGGRKRTKEEHEKLTIDLSVYKNGFRYYDFVDDERHETFTRIYLYNFENTPEKFILKLAEKAKIIGISATAKLKTVTGNYDIDYLERQLGEEKFIELSTEEKKILQDIFTQQNTGYDKVKINTEWIGSSDIKESFEQLFEDRELATEILKRLPQATDLSIKDQHDNFRIYRIAEAFKHFLQNDDIRAFLCLLTKEPKEEDKALDLNLLKKIFNFLIETTKKSSSFDKLEAKDRNSYYDAYVILNSSSFEKNKENLHKRLTKGKKVFVISTYQTLGVGQNLQYVAPNPENLINVRSKDLRDWNTKKETDFNAIYLDKPTYLLQLLSEKLDEKGFITYLFQLEFLLEFGAISTSSLKKEIERAFKYLLTKKTEYIHKFSDEDLYHNKNIQQHYSKIIIQALGRICRTNLKAKNIYIFANDKLQEYIADFDIENNLVLNEFKALVQSCQNFNQNDNEENIRLFNKANATNKKVAKLIKKYIEREADWKWSKKEIKDWKKLRIMCLRLPTFPLKKEKKYARFIDLYIKMPTDNKQLNYETTGDFEKIKIGFNDEYTSFVSEEAARLAKFMKIPNVKDTFIEQKWATKFKEGRFILPPQLFNNIYKGALGEVVGKIIFETKLKINLVELEQEHHELFDFKIENTNIYVDFKHWQEQTKIPENRSKILGKLNTVKGDKVLIINILSEIYEQPYNDIDEKIYQFPSLWNSETEQFNQNSLKKIINLMPND